MKMLQKILISSDVGCYKIRSIYTLELALSPVNSVKFVRLYGAKMTGNQYRVASELFYISLKCSFHDQIQAKTAIPQNWHTQLMCIVCNDIVSLSAKMYFWTSNIQATSQWNLFALCVSTETRTHIKYLTLKACDANSMGFVWLKVCQRNIKFT